MRDEKGFLKNENRRFHVKSLSCLGGKSNCGILLDYLMLLSIL